MARAPIPAYFVLQLNDRADGTRPLRVGYTVTKKVGNAVIRNRVRRRLRAAVVLAELPPTAAGHDAVIIARDTALEASHRALVDAVSRAFAKALERKVRPPLQNGTKAGTSSRDQGQETPADPCIVNSNVARDGPSR